MRSKCLKAVVAGSSLNSVVLSEIMKMEWIDLIAIHSVVNETVGIQRWIRHSPCPLGAYGQIEEKG